MVGEGEMAVGSCIAWRLRGACDVKIGIQRIPVGFRNSQKGVTHPE